MLIRADYCNYLLFFLVIVLIIAIGTFRKKGKLRQVRIFLLIGFILPFAAVTIRYSLAAKFYFIDGQENITTYLVFGNPTFTYARPMVFKQYREYRLNPPIGQVMILNLSLADYRVKRIVYGSTSNAWEDVTIYSNACTPVNVSDIYYLPGDTPPEYSSVSSGHSNSISYQLIRDY